MASSPPTPIPQDPPGWERLSDPYLRGLDSLQKAARHVSGARARPMHLGRGGGWGGWEEAPDPVAFFMVSCRVPVLLTPPPAEGHLSFSLRSVFPWGEAAMHSPSDGGGETRHPQNGVALVLFINRLLMPVSSWVFILHSGLGSSTPPSCCWDGSGTGRWELLQLAPRSVSHAPAPWGAVCFLSPLHSPPRQGLWARGGHFCAYS